MPSWKRGRRPWASTSKGYGGPGLASSPMENDCPRCHTDIEDWRDACKVNGRWIHKRCASGADDE